MWSSRRGSESAAFNCSIFCGHAKPQNHCSPSPWTVAHINNAINDRTGLRRVTCKQLPHVELKGQRGNKSPDEPVPQMTFASQIILSLRNNVFLRSALFLSEGLPQVLQVAELWSHGQEDSNPVGRPEHSAQESSPNPRDSVQHAPTGSGKKSPHRQTQTVSEQPATSRDVVCSQRVALSFDFPYYGHYLRQITVATGGEL